MTTATEFIYVDEMVRDFPYLSPIATRLQLPDQAGASDSIEVVKEQLKKVTLSPTLHFLQPGGIKKKFGFVGISTTVPDENDNTKWHVAVELQGPNHRLIVGSLMTAYGHYIEDIASGQGYLKGGLALRGTSFDNAVKAIERSIAWWAQDKPAERIQDINPISLRKGADVLVGVVNGLWLALACGIDPVHARLQLLIASTQHNRREHAYVGMLVLQHLDTFEAMFTDRGHYDHNIGLPRWVTEKEMCLNFDAVTSRFFSRLR